MQHSFVIVFLISLDIGAVIGNKIAGEKEKFSFTLIGGISTVFFYISLIPRIHRLDRDIYKSK